MKYVFLTMCALSAMLFVSEPVSAKKKKAKNSLLSLAKDSTTANSDYTKIVKGGKKTVGLFTVIYKEKDDKLYFEIPDSAFSKSYMLANRIASTSNTNDFVAGQMATNPMLLRLSKDERSVYLHQVSGENVVDPKDPIAASFDKNFLDPVLKGFKIVARNGNSVVIDVTSFFGSNEASISPIKRDNPFAKLFSSGSSLKGSFLSDASGISEVKAFEKNIEVKTRLSFALSGTVQYETYSVLMHRSLFVLPDNPMPMRFQDNRVGFFHGFKNIFSSNTDRVESKAFIERWRVEPKDEDRERYFRGELVEPKKPIVFYVDSAFPDKWRQTIKDGIEVWNRAFEKAGFKNAVIAKDYPRNDSTFDPDDMRYNCFKYATTATPNAMGPSHSDPRTGEILCADVLWYHNILSLLHNWRFVQTGAVDARVRKDVFDDDIMKESIKYAASHEIGHTLGLMHNMGASYSYPVDSLRSATFTQKYGTTPSIMDYARNNYVAQPGDLERGVNLLPPDLGVYDIFAIEWGYRLIEGAKTPEDEKPTLDKWIAAKANDPMYEFGAQQFLGTLDPTDLTEDLGDDHMKAGDYGIKNLKVLMKNLEAWTNKKGERYDQTAVKYKEITRQYMRYIGHVIPYIGGMIFKEIRHGENAKTARGYVNKADQKRAMLWLLNEARTYRNWLTPPTLMSKLEMDLNVNDRIPNAVVASLLNGVALYRIKESSEVDAKNNYQLNQYLDDVMNNLFIAPKGGQLSEAEQRLQGAAIALMMKTTGLDKTAETKKASFTVLDEWLTDLNRPTLPCGHTEAEHSFSRLGMPTATLTASELGSIMLGRLQKVLTRYKTYRAATSGTTKDFYNYQILLIERLLTTK